MAKLKDTEINGNLVVTGDWLNSDGVNLEKAFSNPNLFLNPDFSIWQRGETITVGTTRTYTADRWGVFFKSAVSRNVDGAGMKIVTEAGDYGSVNQYVEFSYESIGFLYTPLTLTVRLKTNRIMNASIGLVGNSKPITTTTDWVTYTYTFSPKPTDFIYMDNGTYYLRVNIFACDSNNLYQNGDIIEISWAKLELGSIATPFVPRPYAEELAMCQRYYYKISGSWSAIALGRSYANKEVRVFLNLPCVMRNNNPTVVLKSGISMVGISNIFTANSAYIYGTLCVISTTGYANFNEGIIQEIDFMDNASLELDAEIY